MSGPNFVPSTVLVYVGLDFIGDALMKMPFVIALRQAFPGARITWLAGKGRTVFKRELAPLVEGRIDAFFQGAIVPIPAIAAVTDRVEARVFGLSAWEIAGLVERYRYLSPMIVPARTYRGQATHLATVASWNFAIVHKDLPEARVLAIMRAVFESSDPARDIHPFAAETQARHAAENRVIPFHPGALRFYREAGMALR